MMGRAIRWRMALAAVLPVLLVVVTVATIFWRGRVEDLEDSHRQRVDLLVHQVALFSAYGLFSGNSASLQDVVLQMQREPGVRAVLVLDADDRLMAISGKSEVNIGELGDGTYVERLRAAQIDVAQQAIMPSVVPIEDLFSQGTANPATSNRPLGKAVIEVSRQDVEARKRETLLTALWVGSVGIWLGGLLAYRLGNRVVQPLMRVSEMVQRIGQGHFEPDTHVLDDDPLHELQHSLNQMAARLAWGREELERQVETVTRELRLQKEQAESATLAKSRFLAAASHDLRQPSHALGMFVARLGQLPMEPQMRQLVDNMEISVQATQDLLDGLLDLSRLDAGKVPVRMGTVDLQALQEAVYNSLHAMAEAKGLRLRIRPTPLWGHSDPLLLQRMLFNLVVNAIRYTERGTVLVACRLRNGGRSVCIEVRDSGIGIPPEHHENIFKEFYQLANRSGDRNFGLGLGLNIVQRSAALLGHSLGLRSQVGRGTCFTILMDRAQPGEAPAGARVAAQAAPGDLSGMQVLLIEDNTNARAAVAELLQSWGCRVHEAGNRDEALAHLQDGGPPDVILSDYHLGTAENGIDCIVALRKQSGRDLAACLMSGETHADFLQQVQDAQLPLLHKPVRPAKLRSLLRRLRE